VLAVADSDSLSVDVASRVGESESLGVHVVASRASGLGSAGSADSGGEDSTSGLGASVDGGRNRDHGTVGGRVDSGGRSGVRAAVASNRSGRDDGGSRADVDGLRYWDDLGDHCSSSVSQRAVSDGRSARGNGDYVGRVDGRGCEATSRDGGSAASSTSAVSVGDTLGELDTGLGVGSLDIAVESASTSGSIECGANTRVGCITEVQAVVQAGGNSTSGEGEVGLDINDDTKMIGAGLFVSRNGLLISTRKKEYLLALDLVGEARVVDVEREVEARAELAVKSRNSGVRAGTTTNSRGGGVHAGAATNNGRGGHGAARGSRRTGGHVTEVVLGDGRSHAREGQDGGGGDGSEGRHFDFVWWWWWLIS
jgi:hypothetical protein